MKENKKRFLVLGMLFLLTIVTFSQLDFKKQEQISTEKNYAGLYYLGLIPNSKELPETKADKILAISNDGTKALIDSPFGYVYERSVD